MDEPLVRLITNIVRIWESYPCSPLVTSHSYVRMSFQNYIFSIFAFHDDDEVVRPRFLVAPDFSMSICPGGSNKAIVRSEIRMAFD